MRICARAFTTARSSPRASLDSVLATRVRPYDGASDALPIGRLARVLEPPVEAKRRDDAYAAAVLVPFDPSVAQRIASSLRATRSVSVRPAGRGETTAAGARSSGGGAAADAAVSLLVRCRPLSWKLRPPKRALPAVAAAPRAPPALAATLARALVDASDGRSEGWRAERLVDKRQGAKKAKRSRGGVKRMLLRDSHELLESGI